MVAHLEGHCSCSCSNGMEPGGAPYISGDDYTVFCGTVCVYLDTKTGLTRRGESVAISAYALSEWDSLRTCFVAVSGAKLFDPRKEAIGSQSLVSNWSRFREARVLCSLADGTTFRASMGDEFDAEPSELLSCQMLVLWPECFLIGTHAIRRSVNCQARPTFVGYCSRRSCAFPLDG